MTKLSKEDEQKIARFNECYKCGDTIQLMNDSGILFDAIVTHGAHDMYGQAVVYLESIGAYALERVQSQY